MFHYTHPVSIRYTRHLQITILLLIVYTEIGQMMSIVQREAAAESNEPLGKTNEVFLSRNTSATNVEQQAWPYITK